MMLTTRIFPAQMVQALALLAALVGVATWASLLLTSAESHIPPAPPHKCSRRAAIARRCSGFPTRRRRWASR
ncbi:hypothetical protein EMIT0P260_90250 [Pseudomonas sp. IT-P260]